MRSGARFAMKVLEILMLKWHVASLDIHRSVRSVEACLYEIRSDLLIS